MTRRPSRIALAIAFAAFTAIAGCSGEYGYTRSVFQGKVVDRTASQIEDFAGKPDAVETISPEEVVWTYNKRTFDSENANSKDAAVKITLKKDKKTGEMAYASIDFVSM